MPAIGPAERRFGQREAAQVTIVVVAEPAVVPRAGDGCAHRDEAFARQQKASDQARVEPARVEPLAERGAGGSDGAAEGAALAVLDCGSDRHEEGAPGLVVPEESRPQLRAPVARQVGPAVAVEVLAALAVRAAEQCIAPSASELAGGEADRIGSTVRGLVDEK